jgi:hypothetical protein
MKKVFMKKFLGLGVVRKSVLAAGFLFSSASFAATYEVPVQPELKAVAQFEIQAPEFSQASGFMVMHYQLPPELVGPNHPGVTLRTSDYEKDQFQMSSEYGTANCVRGAQVECKMHLKNLNINAAGVRMVLARSSKTGAEFNQRLQVASLFARDPVGILVYEPARR